MTFDEAGLANGITYIASPNFDERPTDTQIKLLVIHNISLPPGEFGGEGIINLFTNCLDPTEHPYYETIKNLHVSAHFLIRRTGEVIQFIPCSKRAWHAGASTWRNLSRCNDFSIGIELEGCDEIEFTDVQYKTLAKLIRSLKKFYPIEDIVGHSDIAPGRKTDPGPYFDWSRLHHLLSN